MNWIPPWTVAIFVIALASPVTAQDQPDPTLDREARQLYEAGQEAFSAGRHESALEYFRRAYDLSRRPALLYNVALTADRLRRDEEALAAFEQYLELEPETPNRGDVDARVAVLRRQIAQARARADADADTDADTDTDTDTETGGLMWSWVGLGGTVLLAGGAALLGLDVNSTYGELAATCGARGCSDQEISDSGIEGTITLTNVLWVGAAIAAAGTVVLFVLESGGGDDEPDLEVSLGAGRLVLGGRF